MTTQIKPNPGSDEALKLGCTCPVMDNEYGQGCYTVDGVPMFWISGNCSLHGGGDDGSKVETD